MAWSVLAATPALALELEAAPLLPAGTPLELTVTNTDGTAASSVTPQVVYQGRTYDGDPATLAAGMHQSWSFPLPAPASSGTFPAMVRVRWTAASGDTQALPLVMLVATPGAPSPLVHATLTTTPGPGGLAGRLLLRNAGTSAVGGRVVVVLPSGLWTEPESQAARVDGGGESLLPLVLEQRGRGACAPCPVYAVLTYVQDGIHHTVLARSEATLAHRALGDRLWPLAVGTTILALTLGLLALAWRRALRRAA
jgi:hypothetical protein